MRPISRLYPSTSAILASPRAASRLSLISRHLEQRPALELNTPYSTERSASPADDVEFEQIARQQLSESKTTQTDKETPVKMSTQPPHPALLIPGPIEFDDAVLNAMSHFR